MNHAISFHRPKTRLPANRLPAKYNEAPRPIYSRTGRGWRWRLMLAGGQLAEGFETAIDRAQASASVAEVDAEVVEMIREGLFPAGYLEDPVAAADEGWMREAAREAFDEHCTEPEEN